MFDFVPFKKTFQKRFQKEQLEKKVEKGEKFHPATASKKHQAPPKRNSDAGKLADKASIVFEKFDLNKVN